MPHATMKLIPGVDQNKTEALNEAAISESQLVRFIPDRTGLGLVQKLGGWARSFPTRIDAIVRALWAWADTNGGKWLAAGCDTSSTDGLFAFDANTTPWTQNIITPRYDVEDAVVDVSTTAGSSVVTIVNNGSDTTRYDAVWIKTQISVGGLILFGVYPVTPLTANSYTIIARDTLGEPIEASATVANGGAVPVFNFTQGSATVTVDLDDHGLAIGDNFPVLVQQSIGDIVLFGNYTVVDVINADTFEIIANARATGVDITGASGTGFPDFEATVDFISTYALNVGDTATISGMNPAGYDAAGVTLLAATATSATYASTETGAFVSGGTLFVDQSPMNGGEARYQYERQFGPNIPGTGYGVGGYGEGGYGLGTPGSGSIPGTPWTADDWSLDNWGEILIAGRQDGAIYQWNPLENFPTASIIPQAPPVNEGCFVAMPQRQIVAWGSTFDGIKDPLLVRWCDINNFNSWIGQPTNQAGSYRIAKGSRIVGGIQALQQGYIWTDLSIWAMQYIGEPLVYGFNEIGTGCGLIGRKAAGALGGTVYWMGPSQFFRLGSGGVEPIACPVWDVIFQDLDTDNFDKIRIAPNSRFGEIAWYYPTTTSGGEIAKYVKYNTLINQWDYGTLARTAWINESVLGAPIGATTETYIVQHEVSNDADGLPMNSYFQTGYFVLSDADVLLFIDQVWPDMKWGKFGMPPDASVLLTFYVVNYPGETPREYGPFTLMQAVKYVTPRFRGRLVSIRIESNDLGSFWRIGAMRYRYAQDGKFY